MGFTEAGIFVLFIDDSEFLVYSKRSINIGWINEYPQFSHVTNLIVIKANSPAEYLWGCENFSNL